MRRCPALVLGLTVFVSGAGALGAPPPNDLCTTAIALTVGNPVAGTTVEAKNDYRLPDGACFGGIGQTPLPGAGLDVVYRFTAPEAGAYSIRVTGTGSGSDVLLYVAPTCPTTGTPPLPVTSCLAAANRTGAGGAEETPCVSLGAGQSVYAYVDEGSSTAGTPFTVEVDRCTAAQEPSETPASAVPLACGIEGSIGSAADVDMFLLGVPAPGSRAFAVVDGVAANSGDFDLRVTTASDALEYDDADNDTRHGALAPNIAGRSLTGSFAYLRVDHRTGVPSEPYRLYSAVHAPESPTVETEPNDSIAQASSSPKNYFQGALSGTTDADYFRFTVAAGDLVVLGLDADPGRNLTPIEPALALLDGASTVLASADDPNAGSNNTPGTGNLGATTPHSPGEAIVYRARTAGTLYARVTGPAGDYVLSVALNCRTLPGADLAVAKAAFPSCVGPGGTLTFTITATNVGTTVARNVVVTDPLPAGVTLVSATPSQGGCRGATTVVCHLGQINGGASATVTLVTTANTSSTIVNTARVSADSADGNAANDSATTTTNGPCDDASVCTTNDACSGGVCTGTPIDCSDTNPCTDDVCIPATGCSHPFNTAPCNDGNVCTTGDACSGGVCAGAPADCSDGNPCTDDACVTPSGCTHSFNNGPCDDGNSCSTGDRCSGGACRGGSCHGTCTGGWECAQDRYEQCVCVEPAVPCGGAGPSCEGECPDGKVCSSGGGTGPCTCTDLPPCGSAEAPECAGACATGSLCTASDAPAGPPCACDPVVPACEGTTAPTCGGACPAGFVCGTAGTTCRCLPGTLSCAGSAAPQCGGACPAGQACRPDASSGLCVCAILDVSCSGAAAPACGGRCPGENERCVPGAGSTCTCAEPECALRPFPECGGTCPGGGACRPDTSAGSCVCDPGTTPCTASAAPACGGTCPAGQACELGSNGFCFCATDEVPCAAAAFPTCAGACPGDDVCATGAGGACVCKPPVPTCGSAAAPACAGTCADGFACEPTIDGAACECRGLPVDCGDAAAPLCNGDCPLGTMCLPAGGGRCACSTCASAAPSANVEIRFATRQRLEWFDLDCATAYDVYRRIGPLGDANHDGLADDYGTCVAPGIANSFFDDTLTPPARGLFAYLVTGENAAGEGALGTTSAGVPRPNRAPCP